MAFEDCIEDEFGNLIRKPKVGRPKKELSQQQDSRMDTGERDSEGHKMMSRECSCCGKPVEFAFRHKPDKCPYCGSVYWDKPRDEYKLFMLQDEFLNGGRDLHVLGRMYPVLESYSENFVKKALRNRIIMTPEQIHDKASDMAFTILKSYEGNNKDYKVRGSFGGLLQKIRLGVMFGTNVQQDDQMLSLDYEIKENVTLMNNPTSFIDDGEENRAKYESDAYSECVRNESEHMDGTVCDLIFDEHRKMREMRDDRMDSLLFLVAIRNNFLKGRKGLMDDMYSLYGTKVKDDVDWMMGSVRDYLHDYSGTDGNG